MLPTKRVLVGPSNIHGLGVFAETGLTTGDMILSIDDSILVADPKQLTGDEHEYHCDYLSHGKIVLMQFPERHINYSCDPNSYVKTVGGQRLVLTWRDISKAEEVTYDYSINGYGDTLWECHCGSVLCRKWVHSDFFHLPHPRQIDYLPFLDHWFQEEFRDKVSELNQSKGT